MVVGSKAVVVTSYKTWERGVDLSCPRCSSERQTHDTSLPSFGSWVSTPWQQVKSPRDILLPCYGSLLLEKNTHLCTYKVLHWQQEHTQKFRRDGTVIYEESHGITVLLYHSGMTKFASRWLGKLLVLWVRDACEKEASVFSESRPCV